MKKRVLLLGSATGAALASSTLPPDVPWWGHLLIQLFAVALAFFGGRVNGR